MARAFGCLVVTLVTCLTFGLASAYAAPRCQSSDLRLGYSDGTSNTSGLGASAFNAVFIDLDAQTGALASPSRRWSLISLRNVSGGACVVHGYPRLALLEDGNSLPARVKRVPVASAPVKRTIQAGESAAVVISHATSTTQPGTSCRTSTHLLVAFPGMGHHNVPARIRACNDGLLYTSPVIGTSEKGYITAAGNVGFFNSGTGNLGFGNTGDNDVGNP
jgi:hypothetical protein